MAAIELESIGKLKTHPDVPDEWLISEPVPVEFFDGKLLKFTFYGGIAEDKDYLFEADQAVKNFLEKNTGDKPSLTNPVYKNYRVIQDYYDSQSYGPAPLKLDNEIDIWNYVYPSEINVCQNSREDKTVYLLIHCECEWEPEHGLQLAFKNGVELTRVSDIDGCPTE